MAEYLFSTAALVHIAALSQVIGCLQRDQVRLRFFLLLGNGFYVAYYLLHPDIPLWDAMFWSTVMAAANCVMIVQLIRDQRVFGLTDAEHAIYAHLSTLSPGDFRRVLKIADFRISNTPVTFTEQGIVPEKLYFIGTGRLEVIKHGQVRDRIPPTFIGEVSLMLGGGATATVRMPEGGNWLEWDRDKLIALQTARPTVRAAFERLINLDLARKLAASGLDAKAPDTSA